MERDAIDKLDENCYNDEKTIANTIPTGASTAYGY